MSEDRRKSDRTSSTGSGVTPDQAGRAAAHVTSSHRDVNVQARRR